MAKASESSSKSFLFRDLDSNILIGMASDRYAGWIGQIYSEGRYEKGITRRSHKVGNKAFNEETLPVESVAEYFEHFPLLEIDYTFYRLLLEKDGKPTQNFHVLKSFGVLETEISRELTEGGILDNLVEKVRRAHSSAG
ncbi:MAG: hypothetical protein ABSF48_30275 [Thermodesulfobacteriota bacterium]